jgi:hypothetical protein
VHSRSAVDAARNCAVPFAVSQNKNVSGWFRSFCFSFGGNFAIACAFFTMAFPLACPGLHSAKLDLDLTPVLLLMSCANQASGLPVSHNAARDEISRPTFTTVKTLCGGQEPQAYAGPKILLFK